MRTVEAICSGLLVALTWQGPAVAAAISPDQAGTAPTKQTGVSTEVAPDGFALVTLGKWAMPEPAKNGGITRPSIDQKPAAMAKNDGKSASYRRVIYLSQVRDAEQRYALPMGLLDALIWTESRYNPFALSKAGAAGLGQLMPATANAMGVANCYDPRANIMGAARNLRLMLDQFGAISLAVAAYNAGPGAVRAARGIPPNDETPDYVRSVFGIWRKFAE
jgi:soluble lytic murein transglycosylase-like protein